MDSLVIGIVFLGALVLALMITRGIILWYFRIDEQVELQEQILIQLKKLNGEKIKQIDSIEEREEESKEEIEADVFGYPKKKK